MKENFLIVCEGFNTLPFRACLLIFCILILCGFCISCTGRSSSRSLPESSIENNSETNNAAAQNQDTEGFIRDYWHVYFERANLPDYIIENIISHLVLGPDFLMELLSILDGDPSLYILVDKQHALSQDHAPDDLAELTGGAYSVTRQDLMLRRPAAEALEAMARAARLDGITLTAASAYRSYNYQVNTYNNWVRELGQEAADLVSARPGHSQHQLGLTLDFYPINDNFAGTTASGWLEQNAARFGWSLSYPKGYEDITGYQWESWHYRYAGAELAEFIDKYFDNIQQYALQFIHAYRNME